MNNIAEKIQGFESRMVMQVHDELVFDVLDKEKKKLTPLIVDAMESAASLHVPLLVDIETGDNWGSVQ